MLGSYTTVARNSPLCDGHATIRIKSLKLKAGVGFCDPEVPEEQAQGCGSHGPNPTFDKSGLVIAQVMLFQRGREWKPCFEKRSMRLQVLDTNGVVLTTLDRSTGPPHATEPHGIWTLSGQLPTTLPAGTNYLRVKVKKKTVGKVVVVGDHREGRDVCLAAISPKVAIPAA